MKFRIKSAAGAKRIRTVFGENELSKENLSLKDALHKRHSLSIDEKKIKICSKSSLHQIYQMLTWRFITRDEIMSTCPTLNKKPYAVEKSVWHPG